MGIGRLNRRFARAVTTAGLAMVLLPASGLQAQNVPARLRGIPGQPPPSAQTAGPGQPAQPLPTAETLAASQTAPSMLQQPAQEARIVFTDETLSIHANNSSLSAILRQVASKSGMRIEGLGGDERVFGTFGPGPPRDVLADLLNGTAYNVVLLGDLSDGAPRELILTPATHAGMAPTPPPQANPDEASNEPESPEVPPPPPDVPPPSTTTAPTSGVKTPQQLFEQLQRMRQGQQQQQDPQQQPQAPQ